MTLLHQAAQKAVEALNQASSGLEYFLQCVSDRKFIAGARDDVRAAIASLTAALQQQEVPREPVAHFPIIYAILRPALSTGNIAVRQHAERLAEVLEGDQLASVRELLDRQPITSEPARVIHAAAPPTTQQQEAGNGRIGVNERLPELGTECLVYGPHWFSETPCIRMDCWDEQREALVSFRP